MRREGGKNHILLPVPQVERAGVSESDISLLLPLLEEDVPRGGQPEVSLCTVQSEGGRDQQFPGFVYRPSRERVWSGTGDNCLCQETELAV